VKRWLKILSASIGIMILMLTLFASWLYNSKSGLNWIITQFEIQLPSEMAIESVSGSLRTRVKIKQLSYLQKKTLWLAEDVVIKCDWLAVLYGRLSCSLVEVNRIKATQIMHDPVESFQGSNLHNDNSNHALDNASNYVQQKGDLSLLGRPLAEQLTEFEASLARLPVSIKVKRLLVHNFHIDTFSTEEQAKQFGLPATIMVKGSKLELKPKVISVEQLLASGEQVSLQFSTRLLIKRKRDFHLSAQLRAPEIELSLESKGDLNQSSHFSLAITQPEKLLLQGNWNWNQHFQIPEAKLQMDKAVLVSAQNPVELSQLNATMQLFWPKLTLESSASAESPFMDQAGVRLNASIDNVTNWQNASSLSVQLESQTSQKKLSDAVTKFMKLPPLDASLSVPDIPLAVTANMEASVSDGLLSMDSQATGEQIFSFTGSLQGLIQDSQVTNVVTKGNVDMATNLAEGSINIPQLSFDWDLSESQSQWQGNLSGKLRDGKYQDWRVKEIDWQIALSKEITATIKVAQLDSTQFSSTVDTVNLVINGKPEAHLIKGQADFGKTGKANFQLNARLENDNDLTAQQPLLWTVNGLTATVLPGSESQTVSETIQPIMLNADTIIIGNNVININKACLQRNGKLCLSVINNSEGLTANWAIDAFELAVINELAEYLKQESKIKFTGKISGTGMAKIPMGLQQKPQSQTQTSRPIILTTEMAAEHLTIQAANGLSRLNNIRIAGRMDTQDELILSWSSSESHMNPESKPQGQLDSEFNVDTLYFNGEAAEIKFVQDKQGRIAYDLEHGALNVGVNNSSVKDPLNILRISTHGQINQRAFTNDFSANLANDDFFHASINIADMLAPNPAVDGDINWRFTQWNLLAHLIPNIDRVEANWTHQAHISGPLDNLQIDGSGELVLQQFVVEELGIDIKNSALNLVSQNRRVDIDGVLNHGNGQLLLAGVVNYDKELEARLNLFGERLLLIDTPKHNIILSPKLELDLFDNHLRVVGQVVVDKANISISALPKSAITLSEDEIRISQPKKSSSALGYELDVDLIAQNNIVITGFGINAKASGKLKARKKKNSALMLDGQLKITEGTFQAYQQNLTIEEGQFLFLGSPENPGVQFKAVRKIDDVTVGIIADGSLVDPRLTLFSNPVFSEENILALLLTGRSIESLSQHEANGLVNAAIDLGISQANRIVGKISDAFGLKDIQISSKTRADSTQLSIGTKVNDKLSLGYGTTIDSNNELNTGWVIEYHLTPTISIEAMSGEEVSTSISYKKQFNPEASSTANKEKE